MSIVKNSNLSIGMFVFITLILFGAGCSRGATKEKPSLEKSRQICIDLPRSSIPGNNVKNYVGCMVDFGYTPVEEDVNILKAMQ